MEAATKSTLPDLGLQLVAARDGRSAAERAAQAQRNRVDSLAYQAAATRKDIAATLAKAARIRELKERDAKLAAASHTVKALLAEDTARRRANLSEQSTTRRTARDESRDAVRQANLASYKTVKAAAAHGRSCVKEASAITTQQARRRVETAAAEKAALAAAAARRAARSEDAIGAERVRRTEEALAAARLNGRALEKMAAEEARLRASIEKATAAQKTAAAVLLKPKEAELVRRVTEGHVLEPEELALLRRSSVSEED